IPVLSAENLFDEASPAIAQKGLHPPEVAGRHDVREAVAVDVAGGEGGVADVGPGGRGRGEVALAVTEPSLERGFRQACRRHEIEVAVSAEIDHERPKAPLGTRSNGEGLRVGGRESLRDGRSGRCGVEETGAASDESNRGHRPEPSFPRAEHGSPLSQTVDGRTKYNGGQVDTQPPCRHAVLGELIRPTTPARPTRGEHRRDRCAVVIERVRVLPDERYAEEPFG